jgi:hypothetical protein
LLRELSDNRLACPETGTTPELVPSSNATCDRNYIAGCLKACAKGGASKYPQPAVHWSYYNASGSPEKICYDLSLYTSLDGNAGASYQIEAMEMLLPQPLGLRKGFLALIYPDARDFRVQSRYDVHMDWWFNDTLNSVPVYRLAMDLPAQPPAGGLWSLPFRPTPPAMSCTKATGALANMTRVNGAIQLTASVKHFLWFDFGPAAGQGSVKAHAKYGACFVVMSFFSFALTGNV